MLRPSAVGSAVASQWHGIPVEGKRKQAMLLEIEAFDSESRGLRLTGELDLSTAQTLIEAAEATLVERALAPGKGDLLLDLSGLSFMDSSGLRALIAVASQLESQGKLVLVSPGTMVLRLFELTGMANLPNLELRLSDGNPSAVPPHAGADASASLSSPRAQA